MARILILAGTTEATELAAALVDAGHDVTSSLAGVTATPVERAGHVRRGGFGGAAGLARHVVEDQVDVLVDATHPFAAVMPFHAAAAGAATGVATCRLLRAPWAPVDGDDWHHVTSVEDVAAAISKLGARRVFLTLGRQSATVVVECDTATWFLVRAIEPVAVHRPGVEVVLQRGPFDIDDEVALLRRFAIDTMAVKNAGGTATAAKLVAARRCGVSVIVVDRPPQPEGLVFGSAAEVVRWCAEVTG
jgi:precorrin-6A/cobalt-precorrin-6A reductase